MGSGANNHLVANGHIHHDVDSTSEEYARRMDAQDPLRALRKEFIIPTKADMRRKTLAKPSAAPAQDEDLEECIYLCGNSLGLQPRRARDRIASFLTQWSTKAVKGHFVAHDDSPLLPFLYVDDAAAKLMAPVVGASQSEVAVMGELTANLHVLMASFYRPTKEKYKIILEGKAFPSDHFAVESQIAHYGFDPKDSMVLVEPGISSATISTAQILQTIDENASETALILLPGVQYYTGQYFDIFTITKHAHSKGILIGWDCAHAAGNVELKLHDWDVDFAVWCNYKYLNSGPGAIAGLFVHERHGQIGTQGDGLFRHRLCGWWGADQGSRFNMDNSFVPRPGAAGYQLSNPSALDMSAVVASLEIFNQTSISDLRKKSVILTSYLERILLKYLEDHPSDAKPFEIITPDERGAQLSILLRPGLMEAVFTYLDENGVIVDERKPDVIRVAPAPLYNTFLDVWNFSQIFFDGCEKATTKLPIR